MKHLHEPQIPLPISSLMGTNSIPSEDMALQIRELLVEHKEMLPLIEAGHASSLIQASELEEFKTRINNLESLISPARKLIPELVSMVFEFCVSTQGKLPMPCVYEAPLLLGQICGFWRRIALSTPKLWRSMQLRLDLRAVPENQWLIAIRKQTLSLETWLTRAGTMPLFLRIEYVGSDTWIGDRKLSQVSLAALTLVSKLMAHQSHWRNIHLQISFHCLYSLFEQHQIVSPTLKVLNIAHIPFSPSDRTPPAVAIPEILSAPNLRSLQLDIPPLGLRHLRLPWNSLVELTLMPSAPSRSKLRSPNDRVSLGDALNTLQFTPNLKRCTLAIGKVDCIIPETSVVLPDLQKLSIFARPAQFGAFLDHVVLPRLENFIIHKHCDGMKLLSFLAASAHPIKELSFVRIRDMSDDDLLSYLQQVPSLLRLHCSSGVSADVLRALTPSTQASSQACLCPELTFVEFRCWRPFDALVEMTELRWRSKDCNNGVSQLKSARFHMHCWPNYTKKGMESESELIRRLQKCRDEGLDIYCQL